MRSSALAADASKFWLPLRAAEAGRGCTVRLLLVQILAVDSCCGIPWPDQVCQCHTTSESTQLRSSNKSQSNKADATLSTPLFPNAALRYSSPTLVCATLPQHCSTPLGPLLHCSARLFPNTSLHHSSQTRLYTPLPEHISHHSCEDTSLHHSSPTLSYATRPQRFSTPLLPNTALHRSAPSRLYNTLPQLNCSTPLFPNTALHHSSSTLLYFPNPALHQSSPTRLFRTLRQHCSARLFPNTALHHFTPTLLYTTLLQHFSTPLFLMHPLHGAAATPRESWHPSFLELLVCRIFVAGCAN